MNISKHSILLSLSFALLLAFSLVTGCVSNQAEAPAAEAELTDDTVRTPTGSINDFWDGFGWVDMTKAEQELWGVLGWNEDRWEGDAKNPASEDKYWRQLSEEEQEACKKLGYTKRLWDGS